MTFGAPEFLALLAAVPLTWLALAAVWRRRERAEAGYAGQGALAVLSPGRSPARRALQAGLLLAAVAFVALAAARPQFGSREVPLERRGVDLMMVLDVSESMEADDVAPSRRERAQQEISALLDRLQGDRVGLVLVADSAYLRSPLSSDLAAIQQLVASASRERLLLEAGTALGEGVDIAADALAESEAMSRIILVVSDGEDHGGRAVEAARAASGNGLLVYAAGVGTTEGGTIPQIDPSTGTTGTKIDPTTGAPLITRLDDALLRGMAAAGGGRYVNLGDAATRLAGLADDFARLRTTVFTTSTEQRREERFQWFVAGALLLFALELALPDTRRMPRLPRREVAILTALAVVAGLLSVACGSTVHKLNDDGNHLFAQGEYDRALESYQRARAERPDLLRLDYNIGNALHRLGEYSRAAEVTQRATAAADADLAFLAYYSLGNHYYRLGSLQFAFDAYKQALILKPDDVDSKYSLEVVLRALADQPAPPPEAPLPSEGGDSGEEALVPSEGADGQSRSEDGQAPPSGSERAQADQLNQALADALAGIDEEFTIEEALRVLDILREQQRLQPEPGSQPGSGQGLDY